MTNRGLSSEEARERLEKFGRNSLPEKKRLPLWVRFLRQFQSPLIYILLFALIVDLAIFITRLYFYLNRSYNFSSLIGRDIFPFCRD